MLGPAHAALGTLAGTAAAAFALEAAIGRPLDSPFLHHPLACATVIIVGAGAGLLPDVDSRGTLVRTLGIFGTLLNWLFKPLCAVAWHLTARKHDHLGRGGYHRKFTHTLVFAVLMSGLVYLGVGLTGGVGSRIAIVYMGAMLAVAVAGLASRRYKRASNMWGPYAILLGSVAVTIVLFIYGPSIDPLLANQKDLAILFALATGAGILSHSVIGDGITIEGTPLLWPIPIKGQAWYRLNLARFSADSKTANAVIFRLSLAASALIVAYSTAPNLIS